jgi:hypothetical protein
MKHTQTIPQSYMKLRENQSAQAFETQTAQFADRVSKAKDLPEVQEQPGESKNLKQTDVHHSAPRPTRKRIPRNHIFFVRHAPYTYGFPSPEYATRTPGTGQGAYHNIEAYADHSNGRLSVGIAAGIIRDADWTGKTYYNELPDRWQFGDAIRTQASIAEIVDIPRTLLGGSTLYADVDFRWEPMYPSNFDGGNNAFLYNAIENTPGLSSSPLDGFVGVSATAELAITLMSGDTVLGHNQTQNGLLSLGINAKDYGLVQDKIAAPFLFLDFAFSPVWKQINLLTSILNIEGALQLIIETTVYLTGYRGGVNDRGAGFVTAAFMDLYNGATPVSNVPFSPNPFVVNGITAYSALI